MLYHLVNCIWFQVTETSRKSKRVGYLTNIQNALQLLESKKVAISFYHFNEHPSPAGFEVNFVKSWNSLFGDGMMYDSALITMSDTT